MAPLINQTVLLAALDWAYEKALAGGGPFTNAYVFAQTQNEKSGSAREAAGRIVSRQVAYCATSGFVTGLGGLLVLPLALPANLASVLLLQLRMVLAIAILGGFDPRTEAVKSLSFACLTGTQATGLLREAGIEAGEALTQRALVNIGEHVMNRIQTGVQLRLLAKTGRAGFVKLGKAIPLVGGVVGGTIDAAATQLIGKAAITVFLPQR